jgi:hydrogenase maturation protease
MRRKGGKMGKTLIIGYGNPLRGDDGFGWHAARTLSRTLAGRGMEVVACHQLTPELAEPLSQSDLAVFIDADARGTPGRIHRRVVHPEAPSGCGFSHSSTPSGLLADAQNLYGARPRGVAITVSAETFAFGETLSPVVAAALARVVEQVRRLVGAASVAHL